jgi:spermidine synthase
MKNKIPYKFYFGTILMFFFSGLTSLIYQVIWIRQLSLAVGSTSASMSLVLSIFFLGLAGGSYFIGKHHQKIQNPLLTYGKLEGFIGIYSAVLVYLLFDFQSLLVLIYPQGEIHILSQILKFILVFIFLILPTLAMGATLPLLVKAYESYPAENNNSSVSLMYGVNTLGAVFGSFISGFILIPSIGIEFTNHFAVLLNLTLFGISWIFASKRNQPTFISTNKTNPNTESNSLKNTIRFNLNLNSKLFLFIAVICGFATISAEVVWSKYLGIFMGTNIYGLSLILSIFLFGLSLGSLALPKIRKFKFVNSSKQLLILLIFMLTISLWMATLLLGSLPLFSTILSHYLGNHFSLLQIKFFTTTVILFTPTFISGMILPLLIELLSLELSDLPLATGAIYSINTVGSIAGSYLSGVLLIPLIGSAWTLKIALNTLFLGLVITVLRFSSSNKSKSIALTVSILLAFGINKTESLHFKDIIRSAYHQSYASISNLDDILKIFSDQQEEFIKIIEGETAVISLGHDQADGPEYKRYFRLKTNGLNESVYDSNNRDALPKYEALLGLLPYVLTDKPENAFLVGYGGGFSTHFFGSTELKSVMVAELEKGIIDAAQFVWHGNNPILQHQNINLKIEDARFLLAVGNGAPYDIIASQPSHSWLSGVANLFTLEFFQLVKSQLKPHGVFSQWLNLYNIDEEILKSILKTFYTVFPNGAVFTDLKDDEIILIGSIDPLQFDLEKVNRILSSPKLQPLMRNLNLKTGYDLLTHMTLTRNDILKITQDSQINTDRNAYAETKQSRLFYNPQIKTVQQFLDDQFAVSYDELILQTSRPQTQWFQILSALNQSQNFTKYNKVLDNKKDQLKNKSELALAYYQMERYASAQLSLEKNNFKITTSENLNLALRIYSAADNHKKVSQIFSTNKKIANFYSYCISLESYLALNELQTAKSIVTQLENNVQQSSFECGTYLYYYLGHYYNKINSHQKAISYLDLFYKENPDYLPAIKYLIGSLIASELNPSSYAFMALVPDLRRRELDRLKSLRDYYQKIHAENDAEILQSKIKSL